MTPVSPLYEPDENDMKEDLSLHVEGESEDGKVSESLFHVAIRRAVWAEAKLKEFSAVKPLLLVAVVHFTRGGKTGRADYTREVDMPADGVPDNSTFLWGYMTRVPADVDLLSIAARPYMLRVVSTFWDSEKLQYVAVCVPYLQFQPGGPSVLFDDHGLKEHFGKPWRLHEEIIHQED